MGCKIQRKAGLIRHGKCRFFFFYWTNKKGGGYSSRYNSLSKGKDKETVICGQIIGNDKERGNVTEDFKCQCEILGLPADNEEPSRF